MARAPGSNMEREASASTSCETDLVPIWVTAARTVSIARAGA